MKILDKQFLKIAKIGIAIQSRDLLSIMDEPEKRLLKPFLTHPKSDKDYFSVNAGFVCEDMKINNQNAIFLLKKIRRDFPYRTSSAAKATLRFFKNNWLPFLKNNIDKDCLLIMTPYSFFIFNKKLRRCNILLKKSKILFRKSALPAYLHFLATLKILFRFILSSRNNGILLHASSFKNKGSGYVFMGSSGYGKSTIVKMLGVENALSDDATIIEKIGKKYLIFATPWNRSCSIKMRALRNGAVLKAIFLIEKSDKTEIKKIGYKEALEELLYSDNPFQQIGFFDNKSGIKGFYLFSENMIRQIPVFKLYIKKHEGFKKEFKNLLSIYNLG